MRLPRTEWDIAIGCTTALEAFDKLIDHRADLIITDIMMPQMDGFEFISLIREQNKRIPILFMSARDDLSAKQRGFRIGVDDYMVKPLDLDELVLRWGLCCAEPGLKMNRSSPWAACE
jgi:two-component system OmpR family response regulator